MLSPNYNEREGGRPPSLIILHYTGMETGADALERLCDPKAEVSAHYMIEQNGLIRRLVDPEHRAWHAGKSFWQGIRDINSASIGIEIVNPGHEFGYVPFKDIQMQALKPLCHELMEEFNIPPQNILGHSDIAPSRKQDPGELFDWEGLAKDGIGVWPEDDAQARDAAKDVLADPGVVHGLFMRIGYDPDANLKDLVLAFQRHYNPERVLGGKGETLDETGAARLLTLAQMIS